MFYTSEYYLLVFFHYLEVFHPVQGLLQEGQVAVIHICQ